MSSSEPLHPSSNWQQLLVRGLKRDGPELGAGVLLVHRLLLAFRSQGMESDQPPSAIPAVTHIIPNNQQVTLLVMSQRSQK